MQLAGGGGVTLKKNKKDTHSLIFYSEGKQYHNVFKPILHYLDSIPYPYTYLTSSKEDYALFAEYDSKKQNPNAEFEYIGSIDTNKAIARLNSLKADIVVTSTPHLDVLQIKRSKGVKHYCHIVHALPCVDTYEVFALDYFDSVFTNSPIHTDFIRKVESVRHLKEKQISVVGCTYLDVLHEKLHAYKQLPHDKKIHFFATNSQKKQTIVLIAPSWGREALLTKYGIQLLTPLLEAGLYVIVRPHPQSYVSESSLLHSLQEQTKTYHNIAWDSNTDNIYAMECADIMISDFSGVIFDYVCLFEKPVLTPTFHFDIAGYDLEDIYEAPWVKHAITKIGTHITPQNFTTLPSVIENLLHDTATNATLQKNIHAMKQELWAYQGKSGAQSAKELLKIKKQILENSLKEQLVLHEEIILLAKILDTDMPNADRKVA